LEKEVGVHGFISIHSADLTSPIFVSWRSAFQISLVDDIIPNIKTTQIDQKLFEIKSFHQHSN